MSFAASYASAPAGVTVDLALSGGPQNTTSAGIDTLISFENLSGSAHGDILAGDFLNNDIDGGDGNDVLFGREGDDNLNGGTGDDAISGGPGDDIMSGHTGTDLVSYLFSTAGVTVTLATTDPQDTGGAGTDRLYFFENLDGSLFNDTLSGNHGANVMQGGDGDDFVDGAAGNDSLSGGNGGDTLIGRGGNDTLDGGANPEGGGGQGDILLGGEGNDTYLVDSGLDLVDEDFIFPGFGNGGVDTIISTADFYWDTQSVGEVLRISEDVVDAGGDGVTAVGGVFNNTIEGHSGTDVLFGRGGSDTYRGGDGVDFISLSTLGLTDANSYVGVNGVNTVIVEERTTGAFSYDIVFEFESGKDKFDVSDYGFASQAAAFATGVNAGAGSSYFILGDGLDYLWVAGRTLAQLSPDDFVV